MAERARAEAAATNERKARLQEADAHNLLLKRANFEVFQPCLFLGLLSVRLYACLTFA